MFDAALEAFHKDIVECTPMAFHADNNTFPLQNTCKGITRKLRDLVTAEDLWSTMGSNSLLKAVNAKCRIHTITDPPAQYTTRVPVDDRHSRYTNHAGA